jgi:hypothetical protein
MAGLIIAAAACWLLALYLSKMLGWLLAIGMVVAAYVLYRRLRNRAGPHRTILTGWPLGIAVLVLWYSQCGILRHH